MANQGFLSVFVVGMSFITQFVKNIKNTITHQTPKAEKKPTQTPQPEKKPTLNPDTLLETLFRTCVKSLLKFQAVSKSWFSLINHPLFIRWHLKFNFSRNCELICNCTSYHRRHNIIALLRANGPPISVLKVDKFGPSVVHCPVRINFRDFSRNMVICGSINGIVVCMSHLGGFEKKCLGLWNPAIMQWKPVVLPLTKNWYKMSVGLGYDEVKNNLKIVCIVPSRDESEGSVVEIYSVNDDTWDGNEGRQITFRATRSRCNFIVKNVPYWIGSDKLVESYEVLAKIDPCTGFYQTFTYPTHVSQNSVYPLNMKDTVVCLVESGRSQMFDVYLLDENTSKWSVIYRLGPLEFTCAPQCLSTGEIVIVTGTSLSDEINFCDPRTNCVNCNDEIQPLEPCWDQSYSHVESLVCVKGMVLISKEGMDNEANSLLKSWKELLPEDLESVLHGAIAVNP